MSFTVWRVCTQERQGELAGQVSILEELDKGFSRTGVQSFALEGLLGELQVSLSWRACIGLTFRPSATSKITQLHCLSQGQHMVPG